MTMMLLSPDTVVAQTRTALGLPPVAGGQAADDALLAQVLRAVAWSNCPCQPFLIVREAERHLKGLVNAQEDLKARLASVLESMVATGDLVEPGQVTQTDVDARGVLFPAPPSFAMLSKDVAQLFGLANEEEWEGLPELRGRVTYEGSSRRVFARDGEPLELKLRVAGLRELSVQAWLREPAPASAIDFLAASRSRLRRADPADAVTNDLEVFDSGSDGIYSTSWIKPANESGLFVARRPKSYGSNQWMLIELDVGRTIKVAHLPFPGNSYRGCDEAWRLQLAKDALGGRPQAYRVSRQGAFGILDILFPLPQWAHRRLLVFGTQVPSRQCICSYRVQEPLLEEASNFLEQRLWMKRTT